MKTFIFFKVIALFFSATYGFAFENLQNYHAKRCAAFNTTTDSHNKIISADELKEKKEVICEYTMEIDDIFIDDSEILLHYSQYNKADILFKVMMGSAITDRLYVSEKNALLELSINNHLFSYFTVICLTNDIVHDLTAKIRRDGYEPIDIRDINQYGNRYDDLFKRSGVKRDVFARWFNEVFSAHEPGFRLENPGLSIRSYNPLEPVVTELMLSAENLKGILKPESGSFRIIPELELWLSSGARLCFDPRCGYPNLCPHSDTPEIFDDEIEACYRAHPDIFRTRKAPLAAEGNNRGNPKNGALGRKFGNPDRVGISLSEKTAIKLSISDYLDVHKSNYSKYVDKKLKDYTEMYPEKMTAELLEEAVIALNNMRKNSESFRFQVKAASLVA